MPKVSIIIPAYNAMSYLPETVQSALRQTFTDFEILIINDGSTDGIVEWATQLTDPRVKLVSQTNQGVSVARNTGIAQAQGEYIAFLDADDLWEPSKLAKQVQCLDQNPTVGLVNTWVVNIDEQNHPDNNVCTTYGEGWIWQQMIQQNLILCGSVAMVRQRCFAAVGGFDPDLQSAEDWEMWIRIASRYPFALLKEPLVFYRQCLHTGSKSNHLQQHLQYCLRVIEKTFQTAPPELWDLRERAYGLAYLAVAWKPIQTQDPQKALEFCRQALQHSPQLRYSQTYLRLRVSIAALQWLGPQGHKRVRSLVHGVRNLLPRGI
ncbi:MAG: glycosyltransferase family A protein [Leptolyngbyaceae bacterium]|nr:glycosyltransferase family A protein [Leptolyngbyaceae bacterium]